MQKSMIVFTLSFLLLVSITKAAIFTASVYPNVVNASTKNQLLNFTLTNTGGTNITQVNITIPQAFYQNVANIGTTSDALSTPISNPLSWTNSTPLGIVANGTTEYFWFSCDVPSVISGTEYNFTIVALDSSNSTSSLNVSVTVNDVSPPYFSANTTLVTNNTEYAPSTNYGFQIRWQDNVNLSTVIFSSNFNSTTNLTVQLHSGSRKSGIYVVNYTDLPAGTYWYQWIANDTSRNVNYTLNLSYVVANATNLVTLTLNNASRNITIANGTALRAVGKGAGRVFMYKNNTPILSQGNLSMISYYDPTLTLGIYEIKVNATGNSNYTSNSTGVTYYVHVVYPMPAWLSPSIPSRTTYASGAAYTFGIVWQSVASPYNNLSAVLFSWNDNNYTLNITNATYQVFNYTLMDLAVGSYKYSWCAKDTQGYWNCTSGIFEVNKVTPPLSIAGIGTYYAPVNLTINATGCPTSGASDVSCVLYLNGTVVPNPYTLSTTSGGTYYFVYNTTGGANWTWGSVSGTVSVLVWNVTTTPVTTTTVVNQTTTTTLPVSAVSNETRVFETVEPNETIVFNVSKPAAFKVKKIEVKVNETASDVRILVAPALLPQSIQQPIEREEGLVFSYLYINSTLPKNKTASVEIEFQVIKSWFESNGIDKEKTSLYKWDGKEWIKLATNKIGEDKDYVYYTAHSSSLSLYAIVGEKKAGFPWGILVIGVVIAVAAFLAYLLWPTEIGSKVDQMRRRLTKFFQHPFNFLTTLSEILFKILCGVNYFRPPKLLCLYQSFSLQEL